jgi:hypothetical protein
MSATKPDPPYAGPTKINDPPIGPERLAVLAGHEKYLRMRDRIGREPLELIREMKHGGYRFKCRRGMLGVLALDRNHNPIPERMSFRQIAPILTGMSGVEVTYETVRRWWEAVFPDEADEPEETLNPDEVNPPAPAALREASDIIVKAAARKRAPRQAAPPVGDEHAQQIREAVERAQAPTTNPDVPPAAFLPPAQ